MLDLREIVKRVGGHVYDGGRRALVPGPAHSRKDLSLSLVVSGDRVVYHSFSGDDWRDISKHLGISVTETRSPAEIARAREERRAAFVAERDRKRAFCRDIWRRCIPIKGSPAWAYLLEGRGIPLASAPTDLAWHSNAPRDYASRRTAPALVAMVRDRDGWPIGLHLTFIANGRNDGRIMVGSTAGGVVRLFHAAPRLALAEGIETALSYSALRGTPCWAALSTSQIRRFEPPSGLAEIVHAADRDDKKEAGIRAFAAMQDRLPNLRHVSDPAPYGMDWNDALRSGAVAV